MAYLGSFNILQGGWITTHKKKTFFMIRDDSGCRFAPCLMLRDAASSDCPVSPPPQTLFHPGFPEMRKM